MERTKIRSFGGVSCHGLASETFLFFLILGLLKNIKIMYEAEGF